MKLGQYAQIHVQMLKVLCCRIQSHFNFKVECYHK